MVSRYYAADLTDHRHGPQLNTIMSNTDEFLSQQLNNVDPQTVEAIQHTEEGTYSLVSTSTDEWITTDIENTVEITQ